MLELGEIASAVLDADGTTRDVTFTPVAASRLQAFLRTSLGVYQIVEAHDGEGRDVAPLLRAYSFGKLFSTSRGFAHAVVQASEQLIPVLRLFIDWPEDENRYALELSFLPSDLDVQSFYIRDFVALIESWRSVLDAEDYFVRYENASWEWYDSGGLGVIYTGRQVRASRTE